MPFTDVIVVGKGAVSPSEIRLKTCNPPEPPAATNVPSGENETTLTFASELYSHCAGSRVCAGHKQTAKPKMAAKSDLIIRH